MTLDVVLVFQKGKCELKYVIHSSQNKKAGKIVYPALSFYLCVFRYDLTQCFILHPMLSLAAWIMLASSEVASP